MGGRAILFTGPAQAGKPTLALRLACHLADDSMLLSSDASPYCAAALGLSAKTRQPLPRSVGLAELNFTLAIWNELPDDVKMLAAAEVCLTLKRYPRERVRVIDLSRCENRSAVSVLLRTPDSNQRGIGNRHRRNLQSVIQPSVGSCRGCGRKAHAGKYAVFMTHENSLDAPACLPDKRCDD